MKSVFSFFLVLVVGGILIFAFYVYAGFTADSRRLNTPLSKTNKPNSYYTPSSADNFWMPNMKIQNNPKLKKPEIVAKAYLSYDLTTNTLILQKNINEKLPIASLTKLMTAIVSLENGDENDLVTIDSKAASIGEDSMGLTVGEKLTVKELLYGLFLNSGNDAAEALAASSPFGRETFVYQMNKKAEDLGLAATQFTNPTGLQGDGNQYSSAHDLLVITRYALEKPSIAEVAQTYFHEIPYTQEHKYFALYNETNLLTTYPGVKGVKTGFTDEAGLCLITFLDYKGHKIIGILLNSPSRRDEMIKILDYSLKTFGINPPPHG